MRSGCYYNFNVTVPTIPNKIGGVKAYCSGSEDGPVDAEPNSFRSCQILEGVNNGVSAKLGERTGDLSLGPKKIYVSFELAGYEDRYDAFFERTLCLAIRNANPLLGRRIISRARMIRFIMLLWRHCRSLILPLPR